MLNLEFGLIVTPTDNELRRGDPESQENWVLPDFPLLDYEALWFADSFVMPTTGESAVNTAELPPFDNAPSCVFRKLSSRC